MKITPLDIRHKEFKRGLRGYSDSEVDEFLDQVADEFERLFKENMDLKERVEALDEKVSGYKRIEDALQKTLVSAQASAEEVKQNASKAAQLVLHEAELKARQMVNAAYSERQGVEQATAKLKGVEQEFRFKFRQMLESYLKQAEEAPPVVSEPAEAVTDAQAELSRHADAIREAIAREETVALSPEEALIAAEATIADVDAAGESGNPPAEDVADGSGRNGEEEAATVPPRPSDKDRILFGETDDLLADVDSGVSDNEFKW
jgi:cell division initiation protein